MFTKTWRSHDEAQVATAEVGLVVKSEALNPRTSRVYYELLNPAGGIIAVGHKDITLDMRREDTLRFLARIPDSLLWSPGRPTRLALRVKTQHEGRYLEYMNFPLGFRTLETNNGRLAVNGIPVTLRVREVPPQLDGSEIAALRAQGYNTLKLLPGPDRRHCTTRAIRWDVRNSTGPDRHPKQRRFAPCRRQPLERPRMARSLYRTHRRQLPTSKRHPSVIAFALATKSANGINLYESYLNMKKFGDSRPFIYPDAAGEWNSDKLELE